MQSALSSNWTFFWKFIFPALWIPGLGAYTLLAFVERQWFTPREKWFCLVSWLLGCFFVFFFPIRRLKQVRMDGEFLYISNYLKKAKVPLRDVWEVRVLSVQDLVDRKREEAPVKPFAIVDFRGQTPFGDRIVFFAKASEVVRAMDSPGLHRDPERC